VEDKFEPKLQTESSGGSGSDGKTRIGAETPGGSDSDYLDLLLKADVISQDQLDEAIKLAGNKHVHTGQMLIMAGYISPRDLRAAIDAQSMLRDRKIDVHLAQRCLGIACKTGMNFCDVTHDQMPDGEQTDSSETSSRSD